jgi:hypothetical protein
MPGDVLVALAQWAGQTVAAAAVTDVWEAARGRFAQLLGCGDARRTEVAERWLTQTRQQLNAVATSDVRKSRQSAAERWAGRFADLLDEDPSLENELRSMVKEIAAWLPAGATSADGHSLAAGRDVRITASGGGIAAGVVHGHVGAAGPYPAGPSEVAAEPGEHDPAAGTVVADRGGTAIGALLYQPRSAAPGMPVRVAQRPVFLAGRECLLAEMDALLVGGGPGPRLVALCGLGGAGKTSVAVEYAHRHLGEVGVCWQFAAEDPAVLEAEFAVLAAHLGARDLVDARDPVASVHGVLARTEAGWLLVFDNVTDRASVERFVPPAGNGRVLFTTQSQHWPSGQALDVPVLDNDVAAAFLVNRTGDPDLVAARELADRLGGLPLALEQAAAYMQAVGINLSGYLWLFRDRQADLLARGEAVGHAADVATTLSLALARLARQAPVATSLLHLLACLAPDPVPLGLLLADLGACPTSPEADGIEPLLGDPVAIGDAVAALRRYSLLSSAGEGLVQIHRLVQSVTRSRLAGAVAQWQRAAADLVEAAVPADPQASAAWPTFAVLLPHARAALDLTSDGMRRMAWYLGESGSYPAARDLFQLIVSRHSESGAFGPEHPYALDARAQLATWTGSAGDADGARDQFADLLPILERILGPESRRALITRVNMAYWAGMAGDPAGARDQLAALLPILERILGTGHRNTLVARHYLARWTGRAGDAARARDEFAALLSVSERIEGPDHRNTLDTRHHLAYWAGEAGDAAGARDRFAVLLPIRERIEGSDHPHTLVTRCELARWTGMAGNAVGARDQFVALLLIHERILGPNHPDTLTTRNDLAYWAGRASDG